MSLYSPGGKVGGTIPLDTGLNRLTIAIAVGEGVTLESFL